MAKIKNKFNPTSLRGIQALFSLLTFISSLFSFIEYINVFSIICWSIVLLSFLLELWFVYPIGRIVFLCLLTYFNIGFNMKINVAMFTNGFIYLIISFVSFLIANKNKEKIIKYPKLSFSRKHNGVITFGTLIGSAIAIVVAHFVTYNDLPFILVVLYIFFFSIIFFVLVYKSNPLNKVLIKFYKSCDPNEFAEDVEILLEDPNLYIENKNYINILKFNYYIASNNDKAKELLEIIKKPKMKLYLYTYAVTKFCYYLYNDELVKAREIVEKYKKSKGRLKKIVTVMENDLKVFEGKETINNLDKLYPIHGKNNLKKAVSTYMLMNYYLRRNNLDKAKEYAKMFLDINTKFERFNNNAKKTLGILVENVPKTVMIYLEKNNQYLMLYRNKKEIDINKGKYIGVGGHVEKDETEDQAVVREVKEETGLDLLSFKRRGLVYFVLNGYIEEMYIYSSSDFIGELIECNEGELSWVDKEKVSLLNLWEGDIHFLKKILNDEDYFKMKLVYRDDVLIEKIDILD